MVPMRKRRAGVDSNDHARRLQRDYTQMNCRSSCIYVQSMQLNITVDFFRTIPINPFTVLITAIIFYPCSTLHVPPPIGRVSIVIKNKLLLMSASTLLDMKSLMFEELC